MLRSGDARALLVVSLDRLTRSVRDLGTLVEDCFGDPNGPALLYAASLNGVYDSQITGGKRYDVAVAGRRIAHATFFESHATERVIQGQSTRQHPSSGRLIAGAHRRRRALDWLAGPSRK
jgi:hypothetical protein